MIVNSFSENQPVDIWNIDKNETQENLDNEESKFDPEINLEKNSINVFNMQSDTENFSIKVDETFNSKDFKIVGLYDPQDFGLRIDMWSNSNGDQLKYLFSNLAKKKIIKGCC